MAWDKGQRGQQDAIDSSERSPEGTMSQSEFCHSQISHLFVHYVFACFNASTIETWKMTYRKNTFYPRYVDNIIANIARI